METSRRRPLAAVAALCLVPALAACNTDPDPDRGAAGDPPATPGRATAEVALAVSAPAEGETVSVPLEVTVDTAAPVGEGADDYHVHVWFGADQEGTTSMHYAQTARVEDAPDGETTMWVQLATADHELTGEPVEVPITIQSGDGGDDTGGDDTGDDTGGDDSGGGDDDGFDY